MKRSFTWRAVLLSGVCSALAALILFIAFVPNSVRSFLGGSGAYAKLSEIEYIIDKYYYKEVDVDALADGIALGYMYALDDDYADYFTKEELEQLSYEHQGGGSGIGVNVCAEVDSGGIYISHVVDGAPADTAGLQAGDIITHINSEDITSLDFATAVDRIAGDKGTDVVLTVLRGDIHKEFTLTRGDFTQQTVFSHMIGKTCYIQITSFNEATVEQFDNAIAFAEENKASGLLFDLRGNAGGLVDSASDMLDVLLPEGDLMIAQYREREEVRAVSDKREIDLPMAVLVDGNTASAGEYFASAIRDYGKGALIGNQTYGKGIMQTTYELSDGSAVKLTVATVTTKSRTPYHEVGLTPDIEVTYTEQELTYWYRLGDQDPYIQTAIQQLYQ